MRRAMWALPVLVVLGFPGGFGASAHAQQWGLYGQATGTALKAPNTGNLFGPTFGFFHTRAVGPVAVGPEVRTTIVWRGGTGTPFTDQRMDIGLGGVRVAMNRHLQLPITPYAAGYIGYGYWRGGLGITRQDKTSSVFEAAGGLDYRVTSHFDWRVAEFAYGRLIGNALTTHPESVSTGVVWHP